MTALRILFAGEDVPGSRTPQRVAALRRLGHDVAFVPSTPPGRTCEDRPSLMRRLRHHLRRPADEAGLNPALLRLAASGGWDILFADNVPTLTAATLRALKAACPGIRLVWYSGDDLMNPRLGSAQLDRALPLFDLWVTTKSFNAGPAEIPARGAKRALFVHNSFDPILHQPTEPSEAERVAWGTDISLIGTFERPRRDSILALCRAGLAVRVWGNGWAAEAGAHPLLQIENRPVYGEDFAKVIAASAINLTFLRKANRDLQTCRSMEIPACGGFMMHERNSEIAGLFQDGTEAILFGDESELVDSAQRWLADAERRARIATAGRARVLADGHDHDSRLGAILAEAGRDGEG
ncbi:glycosyltransferase [Magnetospirillum sp. 15-1]|uniref:CgeB family protein n=1 Tax=Magnetospirillum sp. 15-1 TaxID=1979370 RepID=UPI001483037F|nr:glycosyltransferase [Magnetospirillum sp. 15-1]